MAATDKPLAAAVVARHELQIDIRARPERVWSALVEQMDNWWLPDFRVCPGSRRIVIEPIVGGRWYEEAESGGLLWGHVIAIDAGKSLHLAGHIAPPWGASHWLMHVALEPKGEATVLRISHAIIGLITESAADRIAQDWERLFTDGLKAYVER